MDALLLLIAVGALVGFVVGLTGVGGGSLMTPLLLLFGFPVQVAVGTDLLFASITKTAGVYHHHKKHNIHWRIVLLLAAGSLPAALITTSLLSHFTSQSINYRPLITVSLGVMLILTATWLLTRHLWLAHHPVEKQATKIEHYPVKTLLISGFILGVLVTLSSVGAGVIGTAILLSLFPLLRSSHIIGTDIAHAVPLTLVAGLGHLWLGHVDGHLLLALLIGSLPAIQLGTWAGSQLPNKWLQSILVVLLMALGIKCAFFTF